MKKQRTIIDIKELGDRICLIGPSNSGKSTLAALLGRKMGLPVCHLDRLAHQAGTAWVRRDEALFVGDHDVVVRGDKWIVEGNYSVCMPQRMARATSVIWLDPPLWGCLWRYFCRCFRADPNRVGRLDGAKGEFSWGLIRYTVRQYPKNRQKYAVLLALQPHAQIWRLSHLVDEADLVA